VKIKDLHGKTADVKNEGNPRICIPVIAARRYLVHMFKTMDASPCATDVSEVLLFSPFFSPIFFSAPLLQCLNLAL
jgi:hypothetical protein